jgi:hypothetical protein
LWRFREGDRKGRPVLWAGVIEILIATVRWLFWLLCIGVIIIASGGQREPARLNPSGSHVATGGSLMEEGQVEYRGHRLELRPPREGSEAEPELLIDGEPIRYGQLPDGRYALEEYAYDWHDNLEDLARSYIDYRNRTDEVRREREQGSVD